MRVAVVGAGKMGLPLAVQLASKGAQVTACDVNSAVVNQINGGVSPIDEPGVAEILAQVVSAGSLSATTDTAHAASQSDVIIVIVPALLTPDRDVDSSILQSVARTIAPVIPHGSLVSFETTMPVGGTRGRLIPELESAGRLASVDFDVAFSPERVKSRSVMRNLTVNPKVVGGLTELAAARAEAFYARYLGAPVHNVGSLEAAEFVKLAGMVYRDVNIALANELGQYAEHVGVDLPALREAINSDGEAALLSPGIGVGGHCTPVYPYFLIKDAERRGLCVPLAVQGRIRNDAQAARALDQLEKAWAPLQGITVNILGLAFRPHVREHIFSTAFILRDELLARGANVLLTDPLYEDQEIVGHGFKPGRLDSPAQVLVLNTAHDDFMEVDWSAAARQGVAAVIDGRNVWPLTEVREAGIIAVGIGVPQLDGDRDSMLPIARPVLGDREAEAAAKVVRSGWIMQGPEVAKFESEFAEFVGAPFAVAVSSGTAALHLALRAVGVGPGDEVVTVSHSYIATANAIVYCGAMPVFVDIAPGTFNVDPAKIELAITSRTRAILVVHQYGMPCDIKMVSEIASRHGVTVVEDAACAAGSRIDLGNGWEAIGSPHSDAATFSFHPRKVITTGDGGIITTTSEQVATYLRELRQHGTLDGRNHRVVGFNYRLTDVQAAIGREQLKRLPELVEKRRLIARLYESHLGELEFVNVPNEPEWARTNWQTLAVRLTDGSWTSGVVARLNRAGIGARPGIVNAHRQPAYGDYELRFGLHESEAAERDTIALPLIDRMGEQNVRNIVSELAKAIDCEQRGELL